MIWCSIVDAGAIGAVANFVEALLQVSVGGLEDSSRSAVGLGVRGGVGDGDGDQFAVVAAGDVDGDVERAERDRRAVPGEEEALEHQRRMGIRARARIRAMSM